MRGTRILCEFPDELCASGQLCVKCLAPELGVSVRYVYEMRRLGFVMAGRHRDNQTCTLEEARAWIAENGFRMVRGRGEVRKELMVG